MKTAIVVVNWNTHALLLACIESVKAHAPDAEVWVVDNASSDASAEMVSCRFPDVQLLRNPKNVGFAAANNQAIQASQTPYIWLLNSDTEIHAGALEGLENCLDVNAKVAVAGSRLLNSDGSNQAASFRFVTPFSTWVECLLLPGPLARLRDRAFALTPNTSSGPTDWVLGASMLVRREAINRVGLLDEGYFMYSEEMDWCFRFCEAGYEIHHVPSSIVMHHGGASTKRMPQAMRLELFKSRARYFKRHTSWPKRFFYGPAMLLAAAWNTVYLSLRRLPGERAQSQWAIAKTAWQR